MDDYLNPKELKKNEFNKDKFILINRKIRGKASEESLFDSKNPFLKLK